MSTSTPFSEDGMAKTMRVVSSIIIVLMGVALMCMSPFGALAIQELAIVTENGGLMTMFGLWRAGSAHRPFMHPAPLSLLTLVGAIVTRLLLTKTWKAIEGDESQFWLLAAGLTLMLLTATIGLMLLRYGAWFN